VQSYGGWYVSRVCVCVCVDDWMVRACVQREANSTWELCARAGKGNTGGVAGEAIGCVCPDATHE
jgi:bacterioferritin-associated ferredoxin